MKDTRLAFVLLSIAVFLRKEVFNWIFIPELDSQQISRLVLFQTETVLCLRTAETLDVHKVRLQNSYLLTEFSEHAYNSCSQIFFPLGRLIFGEFSKRQFGKIKAIHNYPF